MCKRIKGGDSCSRSRAKGQDGIQSLARQCPGLDDQPGSVGTKRPKARHTAAHNFNNLRKAADELLPFVTLLLLTCESTRYTIPPASLQSEACAKFLTSPKHLYERRRRPPPPRINNMPLTGNCYFVCQHILKPRSSLFLVSASALR